MKKIVAALTALFISTAAYADTYRITFSPGGNLFKFYQDYTELRLKSTDVIIDGACVSACTLAIPLIDADHLCSTKRGLFAFHSASNGEGEFSADGTKFLWYTYPKEVQEKLKSMGWDGSIPQEHPELIYVPAQELVRACG